MATYNIWLQNKDGTGAAHQLTLSGTGRGLTLQLAGSGRLDQPASDPWTWSGQLANLSLGEPLALQLRQRFPSHL